LKKAKQASLNMLNYSPVADSTKLDWLGIRSISQPFYRQTWGILSEM